MVVAVVEDCESLRVAVGRLLRTAGHEIALFESAEAYLTAPPAEVACLLVDIHLPGMSGVDLQRHLRSNGSAPPPIVLTTADRSFEEHAEELGCAALLVKPVPSELLLSTIGLFTRNHLDRIDQMSGCSTSRTE